MRALHRKLFRDLAAMKGQAAAIAVVVAAGVTMLIVFATTHDALTLTQERFYQDQRFAEVFADLKRAPNRVGERLRTIPGVNQVETRVVAPLRLEVPGFEDPVRGLAVSLPEHREPMVNRVFVREGRLPEPGRTDAVAVSEVFAEAHGLGPGDTLRAIIRGRLETLTITAIVLSPEFVYQIGPGDLVPDYERFGVVWMRERALAKAFAMDGAFNSVVLNLQVGADAEAVVEALDQILAPYGGVGAYPRSDQVSHRILEDELQQVRVMATVLPAIFLGVAAFLLHVLMGRIIRMQREQIAVLKAFGHSLIEIAGHYLMLTGLIVTLGAVLGVGVGAWLADLLAGVYMEYYRFPEVRFRLQPWVVAVAVLVAAGASLLGAVGAVRAAVALPPAEAMRPPLPERFKPGLLERTAWWRQLSQPTRIILRNLSRHPLKAILSVTGIALAGALLLLGSQLFKAMEQMVDVQYRLVLLMDTHLSFTDPTPERAAREVLHLPGVRYAEGYRSVPVRLSNGFREYQTSLLGMELDSRLRGIIDRDHRPVSLPAEGLLLTDYLAEYLGLLPGDRVRIEIMEGRRRSVILPLAGTVAEPIGVSAYMERRAVNRLMGEGPALTGVWLLTEPADRPALFRELRDLARVMGIGLIDDAEAGFREMIDSTLLAFMTIVLALSVSLAFAVIYNNARITLAERSRELATLRVLGLTRAEVSWILIGEIGLLTLLAIPPGWLLGIAFAYGLNQAMAVDMYRIPFVITSWTIAFSAAGVLLASALSLLVTTRRLLRIDLVSALKTGE
ncbi:MAG: FtsX-like permease family protein [Puniceicoccaceae bacterium]|nr:MAG: FtsX-like permease family protein [Puniceicoccaceae bacterium]